MNHYDDLEPLSWPEIVYDFIKGLVTTHPFVVGFISGAILWKLLNYFLWGLFLIWILFL